jgi:8-oxo-dGTP pyrophosphatase MutT (NUDIX family)
VELWLFLSDRTQRLNARAQFSPAAIVRHIADAGVEALRPCLLPTAPALPMIPRRGDYDLNPNLRSEPRPALKPAAVLIPIVLRPEPTVLFTQRTPNLARHAGQVSFPGGRVDKSDASLAATALRETEEETGIAPGFVSIAGFLDPYETGTGFAILPVIGLLREGFTLVPNPDEVADIFEVPLAFLLDPANRERRSAEWQGERREFYAFTHDGHYIWGATAAIVVHFCQSLGGP